MVIILRFSNGITTQDLKSCNNRDKTNSTISYFREELAKLSQIANNDEK